MLRSGELKNTVIDNLRQIPDCFKPDELAYLSLTGKLEVPIQDKLAWLLYPWARSRGLAVTKEWAREPGKHVDIAVLRNGEPEALIELKAMVTSDPLRKIRTAGRALTDLRKDLTRWTVFPGTHIMGVLIAAHRKNLVPSDWIKWKAVKYTSGDVDVLKVLKSEGAILSSCDASVRQSFEDFEVKQVVVPGGEAFDTRVDVVLWLIASRENIPRPG